MSTSSDPYRIRLTCTQCGGTMTVSQKNTMSAHLRCPYCGNEELITESDDVKIAREMTEQAREELNYQKYIAYLEHNKSTLYNFRNSLTFYAAIAGMIFFGFLLIAWAKSSSDISITLILFTQFMLCFSVFMIGYRNITKYINVIPQILLSIAGLLFFAYIAIVS